MEDQTSPLFIWSKAEEIFGDCELAFIWFHTKHIQFENETPDQQMKSKFGRKSVLAILNSIEDNVRQCVQTNYT